MSTFKLTARQDQAQVYLAGTAIHIMLFGGSRSGKTFLLVRNVVLRALKAPNSRHAIFRFRLNALKSSIMMDTFPKVMRVAFPGVEYDMNKSDFYVAYTNGSEIWFGGLDDSDRTEKILGMEFVSIYLNETSQIPLGSRNLAVTRLAQSVDQEIKGKSAKPLTPRMYYDCNPPSKAHWSYRMFVEKRDPETKKALLDPENYVHFQMNPEDNIENLSAGYVDTLKNMSARYQKRFYRGEFADATPNQLFNEDDIEKWRVMGGELPDFVRVVVAVDPSGSGDVDNADNDAIGIVVVALGTDGKAYVLEDCTVKAGPATWGRVAVDAYDRHEADRIVGEVNYGGAMVEHTIKTARRLAGSRAVPYKSVSATRGKAVRAEPISALYEQGKVCHVGYFSELEDELVAFSTVGYMGEHSPNRADALIWGLTDLFPGIVQPTKKREKKPDIVHTGGWMSA